MPVLFEVNMLVNTASGGTWTFEQYKDWLAAANFAAEPWKDWAAGS